MQNGQVKTLAIYLFYSHYVLRHVYCSSVYSTPQSPLQTKCTCLGKVTRKENHITSAQVSVVT